MMNTKLRMSKKTGYRYAMKQTKDQSIKAQSKENNNDWRKNIK